MLKKIVLLVLLLVISARPVWANNKVGIHILETTEAEKAAELVNSSGGDWGYATIVLREDDFDQKKWQNFFDDCRRLHLIPIVRLATHMEPGGTWAKPKDLFKWPEFLNSLNWPVKQQIVVIFNEPNHAKEWGGKINPEEYSLVLQELSQLFKEVNEDFFVLGAGLDQAADGNKGTMREEVFLQEMTIAVPDILKYVDGWCSHSYPNHGFIGKPSDVGRASIKGYEWELDLIGSELPVFITETGWPHKEGVISGGFYSEDKVAEFMINALKIWERDVKVKAITPFVLNYPVQPFDHFSWFKEDGSPYRHYEKVLGVSKVKGEPEQIEDYEIMEIILPEILPIEYEAKGKIKLKNTGQWIMGENDVLIEVGQSESRLDLSEIKLEKDNLVLPGEEIELDFIIKTGTQSAEHKLNFKNNSYTIYVFKPFDIKNKKVNLWQQITTKFRLWWWDFKEK